MIDQLIDQAAAGGILAARQVLRAHREAVLASARRSDRRIVVEAEDAVAASPGAAFRFLPDGVATLPIGPRAYGAGHFETPTIGELRARARARAGAGERHGSLRLFVLDGASAASDIGGLQAYAPPGTLFQVASQFNCLEAPHACLVEVRRYLDDSTQGPRAAISCFPGALLRHYAAPAAGGTRFIQSAPGPQINLLSALCRDGLARVDNGYLLDRNIPDPARFVQALGERFDEIRIGLHSRLEVVLGYDWLGSVPGPPHPVIAQALTSTLAAGGYGDGTLPAETSTAICRYLQRAAHLGTLLGAVALGARRAVLTLIGGGVFGNPVPLIWESILWACDEAARLGGSLDVVVNGRDLGQHLVRERLAQETGSRHGLVIPVDPGSRGQCHES